MKTSLASLALVLILALSSIAAPVTIKTRSGQVFKECEITKVEPASITVSYSDGIATIPLEDLPAELQKQFGYVTKAEQAQAAADRAAKEQAEKKQAVAATVKADLAKKDALAAMRKPSEQEACAYYYTVTEQELNERFGMPLAVKEGKYKDGISYKILVYEETGPKTEGTFFAVSPGSKTVVTFGTIKGEAILCPYKQSAIDAVKDAARNHEILSRLMSDYTAEKAK